MNETQTHFVASCPYCSTQLRIRRGFAGQQVQCKHCNETFVAKETDSPDPGVSSEVDAVRPLPPASQAERIVVTCPSCQTTLSIRRVYLGRQVRCKQCNDVFLATDTPAPIAPSLESQRDRNGDDTERAALQAEVDRQDLEAARLRESLDQATAELEAIRAHLGEIAPAAVRPIFEERASLTAEIDRLRAEVQALSDDRSAQDRAAGERDRQREEELSTARVEVERLTALLEQREADLHAARIEQERLGTERQRIEDEAAQLRATLAEREQATRDEGDRLREELSTARVEVERLTALLKQGGADLDAVRSEQERLGTERQRIEDEAAQLRTTLAERDQAINRLSDEADQLRIDRDRLRSEFEDVRRSLEDREQNHRGELAGRAEQLRHAGELAQERETILAERDHLLEEIQALRRALDDAEQGRRDEMGRLDAELASMADQHRQLQGRHEAAEQSSQELREQNQALQSELDRLGSALPALASDDELQAARAEIESLKRRLDLSDRLQREMAGILGGMGIRVRET